MLERGILYRSATQPVLSRDGTSARWMLNSLAVTMTPRGAELAGRLMLALLDHFDGRQIATYGLTAVPILQSCILQSKGRYRGLLVRKERKSYGSMKLIEGEIDPSEPTILIDDSISSGTSMQEGCERLEEAGLRVEGGICLVRFGWDGGVSFLQESGYHIESVYDIFEDFMTKMADEPEPDRNPTKWLSEIKWSARAAPDGLHPAHLARQALSEYISTGELLRPPARLDKEYDSRGGVWVSLRSREDVYTRYARDGFWHFPGEERRATPEDLMLACLQTAITLKECEDGPARALLDDSSIAVTFFSPLEACRVGELDNDRYGIVVCSRERPSVMGGALPRMPGIANEWEQFYHAWHRNAQLLPFEPFIIYRHELTKAVEPGAVWQPTGVPQESRETALAWHADSRLCGGPATRARDIVVAYLTGKPETAAPVTADLLPPDLDSVYVTVYILGQIRGCVGSDAKELDNALRTCAIEALNDSRFEDVSTAVEADDVAVSVSLLYDPLELGDYSPDEVGLRIRHGQQALMVYQNERSGLLLPFVAVTNNLDRDDFVEELIDKAGITRPPYNWIRFECTSWLADHTGVRRLEHGFPKSEPVSDVAGSIANLARLHLGYILRQQREDGTLFLGYEPFQNRLYEGITAPRLAHAAWVLARAKKVLASDEAAVASQKIVSNLLASIRQSEDGTWVERAGERASISELAFLLLALLEASGQDSSEDNGASIAADIAATLWSKIDRHGRFQTHREEADDDDIFQDYFPGQALIALAVATDKGLAEANEERLYKAFRYYRHRF
ncbi:MAG TPA: AMMECR1 domain-containing protein, partial [Blastocatellia bacterium]|nr:AMMECR1 domain-containing protein [Blastocatellia bacterium]